MLPLHLPEEEPFRGGTLQSISSIPIIGQIVVWFQTEKKHRRNQSELNKQISRRTFEQFLQQPEIDSADMKIPFLVFCLIEYCMQWPIAFYCNTDPMSLLLYDDDVKIEFLATVEEVFSLPKKLLVNKAEELYSMNFEQFCNHLKIILQKNAESNSCLPFERSEVEL